MFQGKLAIITDIHGSLAGLEAVLKDAVSQGCTDFICLGDVIDGGSEDQEVVEKLIELGIRSVRGNHDICDRFTQPNDFCDYIEEMPDQIVEENVLFTHISPRKSQAKIIDPYEAWNVFDDCDYSLIFVGHAHIPMIFGFRSEHSCEAADYDFEYGVPFVLDQNDRYIVCAGSVGYGRDGIKSPRYAIYERRTHSIEMQIVDAPVLPFG